MRRSLFVLTWTTIVLLSTPALVQQSQAQTNQSAPTSEKPSWLPKGPYPPPFDFFTSLCFARVTTDQKTIQIAKPVTLSRTSSKEVEKTFCREEVRTRNKEVDGQTLEEQYTIKLPYTTTEVQTFTYSVAADARKFDIPIDKVRAWELSGKELSATELAKRLTKPTQVLVYEMSTNQLAKHKFEAVEPFFGGVLRLDTIVIYGPPEVQTPAQTNQSSATSEKPSWLPKGSYPPFDFLENLGYVRVAVDQKTIQMMKPIIARQADSVKQMERTSYTTETRTRTKQVDGQSYEEVYTVQVPVTTVVDVTIANRGAVNSKKIDCPLDKVRAWELSGKELSATELAKRLTKPTQVLVYEMSTNQLAKHKFEEVEPFFGGVIRLDTIAVFCPLELTAKAPDAAPTPEPSPAVPAKPSK